MRCSVYKNFRIFSFLLLSILWVNTSLQAVGGLEVEEVSGKEVKSKGILKIQHADGWATGVLFQEGKGLLGLSARHCFKNFHPLTSSAVAWLEEEKRDIIKVYTPKEQGVDLALFVLSSPFQDVEGFPTLPRSLPIASVYEGYVYGYGYTTSSNHPGHLEASGEICRKGKLFITPLSKIEPNTHRLMSSGIDTQNDNNFISFSSFHKNGLIIDRSLSANEDYQFSKLILNQGYIPLKTDDPSDRLLISPSFILPGDSGGPIIGSDNQIYALAYHLCPNAWSDWVVGLKNAIFKKKNYKELCTLTILQGEFGVGFVARESGTLYFALNNESVYSTKQIKVLFSKMNNVISEDLRNYYIHGESLIFNTLLKEEERLIKMLPFIQPSVRQWLAKTHHYNVNYFISIFNHRNWIEKTMSQAFQDVEQLQTSKEIEK